jgi:hypothetical protein
MPKYSLQKKSSKRNQKSSILGQKKNYGNSNISPCQNIIFKKKSSKRNQKSSILGQKKNYGNSNISPCQNIIFKKIPQF